MIRIVLVCLLLSFAGKLFSQTDTTLPNPSVKVDYLKKSNKQKTLGLFFLSTGTVMMLTGAVMAANSEEFGSSDFDTGAILLGIGLGLNLASIPFFILSAKNKRRSLQVSFKNEAVPQLRQGSIVKIAMPSLTFVMKL